MMRSYQSSPFACAPVKLRHSLYEINAFLDKCNRAEIALRNYLNQSVGSTLPPSLGEKLLVGSGTYEINETSDPALHTVKGGSSSSTRRTNASGNVKQGRLSRDNRQSSKAPIHSTSPDVFSGDDSDEDSDTAGTCCICLSWKAYADDPIVFCDGVCGCGMHVSCYSLFPNGTVPDGDFFCESCEENSRIKDDEAKAARQRRLEKKQRNNDTNHSTISSTNRASKNTVQARPRCVLCFKTAGSLKRIAGKSRGWAHPICVLFTNELTLDSDTCRANNIKALHPDRKKLHCAVCKQQGGACVQCHHGSCVTAYHPFCAYSALKQMVVRVGEPGPVTTADGSDTHGANGTTDRGDDSVTSYELYCDKHRRSVVDDGTIASSRITLLDENGESKFMLKKRARHARRQNQ